MPDVPHPADRAWTPTPDWPAFRLDLPGLVVATTDPGPLAFANGVIDAALAAAGIAGPAVGWPGPASGPSHAVAVARDRVLIVGTSLRAGWHDPGFGITDVTDGFVTFTLEGPAMPLMLLAMGEVHLDRPSPSAARILGGCRAIAYLQGAHEQLRILIARGAAAGFADVLSTQRMA